MRPLVSRPKLIRHQPLKHGKLPVLTASKERSPMTICIAAMCNVGSLESPILALIGAADRMLTIRDAEYEPAQTKVFPFASHTVALLAGDMQAHAIICPNTKENLRKKQPAPLLVKDIAEAFADEFAAYRRSQAERHLLTPVNLNIDMFITAGHALDLNAASDILYKLQNYYIKAEAIICGIDVTGAHIFKVIDPGNAVCFDTTCFAAIGSRDDIAEAEFMYAKFNKLMSASEVLLLVYSAKLRAQAAAGVGTYTDMFAITPKAYIPVTENNIESLRGIW
jgi:hypothetical protein